MTGADFVGKKLKSGQKGFFPLSFTEADQNRFVSNEERTFDQHAVGGEKRKHFGFRHGGELVFQVQFLIKQTAGVNESAEREPALLPPERQFFNGWVLFFDRAFGKGNAFFGKPGFRLFAGAAAVIAEKKIHLRTSRIDDGVGFHRTVYHRSEHHASGSHAVYTRHEEMMPPSLGINRCSGQSAQEY